MSAEHAEYVRSCKKLETQMEEIIDRRRESKQNEVSRIGNLPKNEVTLEEYEWWQEMRREGSLSTRMY